MKYGYNKKQGREQLRVKALPASIESRDTVRCLIAGSKEAVLRDFGNLTGEHARVLRLALNEAEALAWQTNYPQLFFPVLAAEKAQGAVKWHQRQRSVRRTAIELAFAE